MLKHLHLFKTLFLLFALVAGGNAWAQTVAVDDVLWTEPFKGTNTATTFSATSSWGNYINPTTFVAADKSGLNYSSSNAMMNSGTATNMDGAHVWLNKSVDGYIQVTGIKLYNATKVKVSWAQATNGSSTTVYYQFDGSGDFTSLSTCSGPNANFESAELSVANHTTIALKFTHPQSNSKNTRIDNLTLKVTAISAPSGTTEAPTISGNTPFLDNTTVTINNAVSADGANIYYTLNGDDPTTTTSATCFAYSEPFVVSATTTVKAIAKKSTDTNASSVVSKTFTKIVPLTVAEAIAATPASGTSESNYIHGIVSAFYNTSIVGDDANYRYYISDDGTTTNQLLVYKGKGLNNVVFSAASDLEIGDEVIIYGGLTTYSSTKEVASGNYLISRVTKETPTFSLDITEKSLDAYTKESVDVTLTTNTDGSISYESDDEDVATVALKSGNVYTITAKSEGTATITISSAASVAYKPASATVSITVTDTRADAGISFEEDAEEITWGDSYTGQALTNTNSVDVTWSSTDEAVATVNSTGVVNVLKAGETEIKATFAGDATYKAAIASYTLTVNKAEAGLSYTTTSFDIMLNDDSFVAPTLNNPNSLTVTYTSNNEGVAVVDENTGELLYDATAEGTAKITAAFAGNDCYKSGSANYTINIIDKTKKGSKYNPYTVAEVIEMAPESTSTPADGQSDIYVTGYIVGEYRNPTAVNTTVLQSSFTTDANIAIADAPTTTALASSIPINLTKTADRNTFGNKTNSGKTIGYKVLIKGDVLKYFGAAGLKNIDEISVVSVPVAISTAGLATYASDYALDYTDVEGIEAYIAKEEDGTVKLHQVKKVPAGTGVLLRSTNSGTSYEVPITTAATDNVEGNAFVRGTGATVESGSGPYNYILNIVNEVLGFYKANNNMVATNRAYLQTTKSMARIALNFDDETTGINNVNVNHNDNWYDMQGRKVDAPKKGLYIVNGRKVVIK